jgi:hypothetical protein
MDRLGGPQHVRDGVLDSLAHGTSVTAKISWISTSSPPDASRRTSIEGKPRWIHCTPLLGSDDKVGVWMIVMVEQETVTGSLRRPSEPLPQHTPMSPSQQRHQQQDSRLYLDNTPVRGGEGAKNPRFKADTGKLYAEYLRREGKSPPPSGMGFGDGEHPAFRQDLPSRESSQRDASAREPRLFKDF